MPEYKQVDVVKVPRRLKLRSERDQKLDGDCHPPQE